MIMEIKKINEQRERAELTFYSTNKEVLKYIELLEFELKINNNIKKGDTVYRVSKYSNKPLEIIVDKVFYSDNGQFNGIVSKNGVVYNGRDILRFIK